MVKIKDFYLLKNNISERASIHKSAEDLQYTIHNSLDVNCKYNRNIKYKSNFKKIIF